MFYNNLAAEAITEDKLDQAYWLSKAALQVDPQFTPGYATLGVLYARKELLGAAEDIYLQGLRISPEDHTLLSNLAVLLQKQPERSADLLALKPKLDALSLSNPFYYAELAEQAFQQGNYRKSIRLYQRSLELSPYIHTSYFGLAKNHYALGHLKQAEKYLKVASEVSDSLSTQKRYQAKLRYLNEIPITSARLNH
jgi:tetratricopeptide (TPR) repeat protein